MAEKKKKDNKNYVTESAVLSDEEEKGREKRGISKEEYQSWKKRRKNARDKNE
jgi:hypothetical protein